MNKTPETHPALSNFPVIDDCLHIGGLPVTQLAQRVGGTPFYAYERESIRRRIETLRGSLPADIHLHYAVKANPMPAVVQFIAPQVDGLDVASLGEMRVALDTGVEPRTISFAGPGKTARELAAAAAAGIVVNVESENELDTLARLGGQHGLRPRVALRINPDFELKSSGMKMGGRPAQFGIDAERIPEVLRHLKSLDLEFMGFHIFSGSQNLRPETIIEAQAKTFDLAVALAEHAPGPLRLLNIGGGFGIPYFPGDRPLDLAPIGEHLEKRLPRVKQALPEAEIVIELGRYLVGEAGLYVCRILDRKLSRGQVFLVTDGGLHHHLAASGNFGQIIRKNYPVVIGNRVAGGEREIASVVGPLCTPLDLLADKMELSRADVGDLVVVYQSGAYGLTASPLGFLGHPPPAEVLV